MFELLLKFFKVDSQKVRDEKYLSESVDIYQLEQRMSNLNNDRSNYIGNYFNTRGNK